MPVKTLPPFVKRVIDSIPITVRIIGRSVAGDPVYVACNKSSFASSGLTHEEIVGKRADEVFSGAWAEDIVNRHREVMKTQQAMSFTHETVAKLGVRTMQTSMVPITDMNSDTTYIVVSTFDITPQLRNEENWLRAETISQDIRQFAALASHDLRTPMRQVKQIVELISEDFEDLGDGKVELLEMISRLSEQTMTMITNLLASSDAIPNTVSRVETFDLDALCLELFTLLDPSRHHNLTRDSVRITTDQMALQVVLRNLIDNSIKHNIPEAVSCHVSASPGEQAGYITFTVTDNGKGISDGECLFGNQSGTTHESGFGMSAIQRLLQARGGSISVDSPVEATGLRVIFCLPGMIG